MASAGHLQYDDEEAMAKLCEWWITESGFTPDELVDLAELIWPWLARPRSVDLIRTQTSGMASSAKRMVTTTI